MPDLQIFSKLEALAKKSVANNEVFIKMCQSLLERLDFDKSLDRATLRQIIQTALNKIK